jgi:hypothetical protein
MNKIKQYLSVNDISFLIDFDKTINIDKRGKAYYFKSFRVDLDALTNFISNLQDNQVYLINPFISINCRHNDPYLTMSRQFLITNNSNIMLINNYLINQLAIAKEDFDYHDDYYFLIFKYKTVELDYRIFN